MLLTVGSVQLPNAWVPNPGITCMHAYVYTHKYEHVCNCIHSECNNGAIPTRTERPGFSLTCKVDWLLRYMLGLQSAGTMEPGILHQVSCITCQCIHMIRYVAVIQSCWPGDFSRKSWAFTGCLMKSINEKTVPYSFGLNLQRTCLQRKGL